MKPGEIAAGKEGVDHANRLANRENGRGLGNLRALAPDFKQTGHRFILGVLGHVEDRNT